VSKHDNFAELITFFPSFFHREQNNRSREMPCTASGKKLLDIESRESNHFRAQERKSKLSRQMSLEKFRRASALNFLFSDELSNETFFPFSVDCARENLKEKQNFSLLLERELRRGENQ
jgi:hypothetical protein